jgi:SAM-dependent methyltransferase
MDLGFRGEVADFYQRYRRGYPPAVLDTLVHAFTLTREDVVVDLGCGTGQLTVPLAERVGAVLGVDPEPDMLALARETGAGRPNLSWVLGADTDLPALLTALGHRRVGAVTVGQALHWMDHERLFAVVAAAVRPGGGIAVLANGIPLWQQDSDWSAELRACLADWLGVRPTRTCGTDPATQQRYAAGLAEAGFTVRSTLLEYTDELDLDQVIGGVYSALPVRLLPAPDRRAEFAARLRAALTPHAPFTEHVPVSVILGTA